ncbi:hypothetical protein AJ87_05855 [Rhizobium yanglingense]|nr:hypothetical protein AJ87_05855 [Rhizobium yanglingense]
MNICDELVSGEPRYRCSIMFDADVEHGDNIESVMVACGGIVIDSVEGSWPLIGTDQPIVETFTDDDLIVGEPYGSKGAARWPISSMPFPEPIRSRRTCGALLATTRRRTPPMWPLIVARAT